jgi:plasmid maintenance system antidote protein VapI
MRDFSIPQGRGGGPGVTAKGLYPEISRTKVARLLGCDPSTVTGYLAGRTKMPLERAIRFAKLAGIPVETLQRDLSRAQSEFGSK